MYLNINDFTLYYEKYGKEEAPVILILPGWGDTRPTFKHLISYFENNYTIYILDYPGFGNSTFPHRDLTIYDYANLIIDFLNILHIENPIIIAHSFGGRIAITLNGYYHHKIEKLILMGSAGIKPRKTFYQIMKKWIYKLLKKCQVLLPRKKRKDFLNKLIQIFGSQDFQKLTSNQRTTFIKIVNEDLTPYLKHIEVPTLLLWGENDSSTPIQDAYKMERLINDVGLVIFPTRGHFCYLEEPLVINKIIEQFIKEENT